MMLTKRKVLFCYSWKLLTQLLFFCLCCGGTWQRLSLRASKFISVKVSEWGGRKDAGPAPLSLMASVGVLRKPCLASRVTHRQLTEGRQDANSPCTTGKYRAIPVCARKRRR